MLRAGALFVAVTISFVIAVLSSMLILMAYHYKIQNRENLLQKKLERNVNSALTLLMVESESSEQAKLIDLYGEESDSVQIKNYSWGVFEVATVKAFSGRYSVTKSVEYGYKPDETFSSAIYLADLSRPLNLCGKTKIIGDCYLPESGVKRGYIEGKSFEGTIMINGNVKSSKNTLPALNKEIIKKLSNLFTNEAFGTGLYRRLDLVGVDTLITSFLDTTVLVALSGNTTIAGKFLSGNIIIYSTSPILIEENSRLEDIILVAPSIKLKKGFRGSIQAFATDSIIVEENCILNYPSALGLIKKDHKTTQPFIKVMKNAILSGIAFTSQSEFVSDLQQTLISIDKDALLIGQLYADGFADIKGEVRGMVWCNKFILKTASSVYENHLLDAVIDRSKLSIHFVGSGIIASGKMKKIIKYTE